MTYSWMPPASSPTARRVSSSLTAVLQGMNHSHSFNKYPRTSAAAAVTSFGSPKSNDLRDYSNWTDDTGTYFWFSQHRRKQSENISPFITPDRRHPRLLLLSHTRHFLRLALESFSTPSHIPHMLSFPNTLWLNQSTQPISISCTLSLCLYFVTFICLSVLSNQYSKCPVKYTYLLLFLQTDPGIPIMKIH